MFTNNSSMLLRNLLLLDAATCALMGVMLALGAGVLAAWMAIPTGLLFYAGLLLVPVAAFIAGAALHAPASRPAVSLIIVGNVLWVAASLALLVGDWIAPNALGATFIGAQALAVAGLAALEYQAWRRTATAITA
jgi:hypothetical protein